ncbi:hypothetical protein [Streptomyces sp. R35]|uniref:Uncharacterized protein n=1 Tax=Streptomyces sp. R35 TaxID=3238630 RepID=A0AB39S8U8_9ACTN
MAVVEVVGRDGRPRHEGGRLRGLGGVLLGGVLRAGAGVRSRGSRVLRVLRGRAGVRG